jgi:ribonuclease HI
MVVYVYTDGGSRGNPGRAAIAVLILDKEGKLLKEYKRAIGIATNNEAEYGAIIKALELASVLPVREVFLTSDSEVVVGHLTGRYKVKAENLRGLFTKAKTLEKKFDKVSYKHARRSDPCISRADRMVNEALDRDS